METPAQSGIASVAIFSIFGVITTSSLSHLPFTSYTTSKTLHLLPFFSLGFRSLDTAAEKLVCAYIRSEALFFMFCYLNV